MDCEPRPINASSFADNESQTVFHLQLFLAQNGVDCKLNRFQTRAATAKGKVTAK
jgi:hypothetical protein